MGMVMTVVCPCIFGANRGMHLEARCRCGVWKQTQGLQWKVQRPLDTMHRAIEVPRSGGFIEQSFRARKDHNQGCGIQVVATYVTR